MLQVDPDPMKIVSDPDGQKSISDWIRILIPAWQKAAVKFMSTCYPCIVGSWVIRVHLKVLCQRSKLYIYIYIDLLHSLRSLVYFYTATHYSNMDKISRKYRLFWSESKRIENIYKNSFCLQKNCYGGGVTLNHFSVLP